MVAMGVSLYCDAMGKAWVPEEDCEPQSASASTDCSALDELNSPGGTPGLITATPKVVSLKLPAYLNRNIETPVANQCFNKSSEKSVTLKLNNVRPASRSQMTLQQRRKFFKNSLQINCNVDSQAQNPFLQSSCKDIADRFQVQVALGQGSTGVVYKARELSNDQQVALKVMRMDDEEMLRIARDEYELLRSVEHPHIVRSLDFFTFPLGAVLVLEFFEGESLDKAVAARNMKRLKEHKAQALFKQLIEAVSHLHKHGIIHRDVKAPNILVSSNLTKLKLVDFNTAKRVGEGALTMTGTADYMPPEVLLGESLSEASDVWASGLCLHLMLSGSLPLERRLFGSHADFGRAVLSGATEEGSASPLKVGARGAIESRWSGDNLSDACKTVLSRCLLVDPRLRPSAQGILASDWLNERWP
jgi:predicted Ser/Thr protein kinase